MKIQKITPFLVDRFLLVRVYTDVGIVGNGEAGLWAHHGVVCRAIEELSDYYVGQDPTRIEHHFQVVSRDTHFMGAVLSAAMSAIDIALWDLIGKATGQPLYKLWGGGRDKVVPYASMVLLSTPEERAEMAVKLMEEGWKAIKIRAHFQTLGEDVRLVETVREAVGDAMEIMVDGNQAQSSGTWQPGVQWDFRRAVDTARELQDLNCYWLEEPLPRFHFDRLAELNNTVEMPIAGGENNTGLHEFLWMCQEGVYDVLQPESMVLDGVTALRKVGALAEFYGKQIVPHHGAGDLGVIAHLHLVASWRHAPFLELLHDPPIGDYRHAFSIMKEYPVVENGLISVPQGPGLGVEIDPDFIDHS